jgi:hypothetical protein
LLIPEKLSAIEKSTALPTRFPQEYSAGELDTWIA